LKVNDTEDVDDYRTQWTVEGSVFGIISLWSFLFEYEISPEPLN